METPAPVSAEPNSQQTQHPQAVITGEKNDGQLFVTFSEKDLEVWADFMPAMGRGADLGLDQVNAALAKLNISTGILHEHIIEALTECREHHKPARHVLIARGQPPQSEVTEYYEMNPHLKEKPKTPPGNKRIDYKAISPFMIVKKDMALAKKRPHKDGSEGINVHGNTIPFTTVRPVGIEGGENTRIEGDLILSNLNGQLVQEGNTLHVREALTIKGAVDYATGNIIFPGDVTIEGPVMDGFKIYSGGAVTMKQTFDVTDAVTKGDLTVSGGIIGRGPALIKCGGTIRTKFIENCKAAARTGVVVDLEIVNSSVYSLDRIEVGDKGVILGGEVYAFHGVRSGAIGKKQGRTTKIHCGIDFTVQQEKEKSNNQMRLLAAKLVRLAEMMKIETDQSRLVKMKELQARLQAEQKKAAARVGELLARMAGDANATVDVPGEIAPGTLIEICQVALFVTEPLKKVRVRLSEGKVISEPLA